MAQLVREITHAHFFCGLGGGAKGFNKGQARLGNTVARFRCLGGIDSDPAAIADFSRLAGVAGTVLDLFSREQFAAFHGREPGPDWRPATTTDIQAAFGFERPNIVFLSAPCKGFSGLLAEKVSLTAKYQALNELTLRGVWLMCEAFKDDPPELIVFENVPRIATRGRPLLDQIVSLLRHYGYAVNETTHDCGRIGKLAQSRRRFLLVARHTEKVRPFLYEPEQHRLRGVGEVLDKLPLPSDPIAGPMHRMPSLQWKTWVRLAFVEAGSDWRSLNRLAVQDGALRDFGILPDRTWHDGALGVIPSDAPSGTVTGGAEPTSGRFAVADPRFEESGGHRGNLGVREWAASTGAVTSRGTPTTGAFSVADPRIDGHPRSVQTGVRTWDAPAPVITGKMLVGGGPHSVADPRVGRAGPRFNNVYRVIAYDQHASAVTGGGGNSAAAVADPRGGPDRHVNGKYRVTGYGERAGAVIAGSTTGNGAFAVADPRTEYGPNSHRNKLAVVAYADSSRTVTGATQVQGGGLSVADPRPACLNAEGREAYETGGHYGVTPWTAPAHAVPGCAKNNNGPWSVADPRPAEGEPRDALPVADDRLVAVIRATDGTWHRPFTTLELAALQSLVDPEDLTPLVGSSDSAWRERIGNAVPPDAAAAIASVMGKTLLLAWAGESFVLSSTPIWVRSIATALAIDAGGSA